MDDKDESTNATFVVHTTQDVSLADRAAVVALQTSHEVSSDIGLAAFVEFYSQHSMPLDVAILWIQYSFRTDAPMAIEMASKLLHHIRCYPSTSESIEELVSFMVTEVLPFQSTEYVQHVLDSIESPSWVSNPIAYDQASEVNHQAVSVLLSRLHMFSFSSAVDSCREQLESLIIVQKDINDCIELQSESDNVLTKKRNSQIHETWRNLVQDLHSKDWHLVLSQRILNLFRTHVVQPLFRDEACWENRGRVALSILLLYLSWKRRRKLLLLTSSAAHVLTSPLREIMDALLPQHR